MVTATAAINATASEVEAGQNYIKNEYLKIVEESDDFCIYTTGGDPDRTTDDNTVLLYDTTSDMQLCIDGVDSSTNNYGEITTNAADKSITTVYNKRNGISSKRVLTFIENANGIENTVEVKFVVTNEDTVSHEVGTRIMLDTMLGSNDDAPFRVPGIGPVVKRLQLDGDDIPAMYQVFNNLENPTVIATGSFAKGAGRPDYVQFNNYRTSVSEYEVECDPEEYIGDSVVNAVWKQATLAPGETREYVVYYGLGEVNVNAESELVLGATKVDASFTVNEEGTGYNPVSIMGYLKNTGDVALNNAEISIELPEGVSLVNGDTSVSYGTLAVNKDEQTTWTINAEPSGTEREIVVKINAKSDEINDIEPITYTFTLPAIEMPTEEPTEAPTEAPTAAPTEAPTAAPTQAPTAAPTQAPTSATNPTQAPTAAPTKAPTQAPTTAATSATTATSADAGKVTTGDSTNLFGMLALLLTSAGTVITLRKRSKNQ